jgi:hypothetical protein
MRMTFSSLIRALAVCALLFNGAAQANAYPPQEKQDKAAQAPEAERKAAQKIEEAKDLAAKMQAANEFVQKYPKSSLRAKVADGLIQQIGAISDNAQRATLAESFMGAFTEASEANRMYPILIDAYVSAKRIDDAFNAARPWLEVNPNEVDVLYLLAVTGTEETRRQNSPKFIKDSQQYGLKAIELIEADKRPDGIGIENWNRSKAAWLPELYQAMGLLAIINRNNSDAITRLEKAVKLRPEDPFNFVLLSSVKNEEYTTGAKQFKTMPAGPARDDMEKKLTAALDEIIDLTAHALGLMEGRPEFQQLRDQMLPELTSYYKFRHNNSTAGMQELINKYKPAGKP